MDGKTRLSSRNRGEQRRLRELKSRLRERDPPPAAAMGGIKKLAKSKLFLLFEMVVASSTPI